MSGGQPSEKDAEMGSHTGAVHDDIRGLHHQTEVKPGPEVRGNAQLGVGLALGLLFSTWGSFTFSSG